MPTIEYGGNPSAWADRGTAEHDHENPTTITAVAQVINSGGTVGRATLNIWHESDDGDFIWSSDSKDILPVSQGGTSTSLRASKRLERDSYMYFRVEVVSGTGEMLAGPVTTSVNDMTTPPPVANLTSGNITITVT
jgi:hypothetical protein